MPINDPEEMIIRFSPIRFLKMLTPLLLLIALSIGLNWNAWMSLKQNEEILWGFFLSFTVFIFIALFKWYYIVLNKDGFTVNYLGGKRFYSWSEVSNFRVLQTRINFIPLANRITFDLREDSSQKTEIIRATRTIRNLIPNRAQAFDSSFICLFKPNAYSLIEVLKDFKEKSPVR